jgi:hypothetical protein
MVRHRLITCGSGRQVAGSVEQSDKDCCFYKSYGFIRSSLFCDVAQSRLVGSCDVRCVTIHKNEGLTYATAET